MATITTAADARALATAVAATRRPGWVTAAAVILLSIGVLSILSGFSLLATTLAMRSVWGDVMRMPGMPAGVDTAAVGRLLTGMLAAASVVVLTWAMANVVAGVGVLGGRGWARILGMVVASIGGGLSLLWLAGMLWSWTLTAEMLRSPQLAEVYGRYGSPEMVGAGMAATLLLVLPFVLGYVLVLVGLSLSGRFFSPRSTG